MYLKVRNTSLEGVGKFKIDHKVFMASRIRSYSKKGIVRLRYPKGVYMDGNLVDVEFELRFKPYFDNIAFDYKIHLTSAGKEDYLNSNVNDIVMSDPIQKLVRKGILTAASYSAGREITCPCELDMTQQDSYLQRLFSSDSFLDNAFDSAKIDERYQNKDNSFKHQACFDKPEGKKNGFCGCVNYQHAVKGLKPENAKKLCNYIMKNFGKSK